MPAQASAQRRISGPISFKESFLPHGFNSKACNDFRVIAEEQPVFEQPQLLGKAARGSMTGSLKGSTVECAYSFEMTSVPSGEVLVSVEGLPLGYKPPARYFLGTGQKDVNGKHCRPTCSFSVDFVFGLVRYPTP